MIDSSAEQVRRAQTVLRASALGSMVIGVIYAVIIWLGSASERLNPVTGEIERGLTFGGFFTGVVVLGLALAFWAICIVLASLSEAIDKDG